MVTVRKPYHRKICKLHPNSAQKDGEKTQPPPNPQYPTLSNSKCYDF